MTCWQRGLRAAIVAGLATALVVALTGCVVVVSPFGRGDDALHETTLEGEGDTKILWLPISGFISDTASRRALGLIQQPSTLTAVSRALDKASEDDDIGALVLRIDSPGGTVAAADEIHARIARYHEETGVPVIASFAGVAASGGYYVAMAADTIIAQPTSITGSIGVILPGVNATGLLDKIGLENTSYISGPNKDMLSPLSESTAEERALAQAVVDSLFARFLTVVRAGRPRLDEAAIQRVTDGRIVAADDALEMGLIDRIGHLDDVLELARERAGVERARVIRYYRGSNAPKSIASSSAAGANFRVQAAGLPVDIGLDSSDYAQPLYLWQPQGR